MHNDLTVDWGNYPQGRRVHPAKVTKARRIKRGDRLVVAMRDNGRRFFVFADDPTVVARIPIGTTLMFDRRISCMGASMGGLKGPSGYERRREVRYGLHIDLIFGNHVTRPLITPDRKRPISLNYVHTAQCATAVHLPRRKPNRSKV